MIKPVWLLFVCICTDDHSWIPNTHIHCKHMQPPCHTAHNKRLTPALTLRRSGRLLAFYLHAVSTEHYYIYLQHCGTDISIQNSWISSLLMVGRFHGSVSHAALQRRRSSVKRRAQLCFLSDYFGTVLSGGGVTALSIYVKRLGHPEIRNTALQIMQSNPRCLSLHVAFTFHRLVSKLNSQVIGTNH